MPCYSLCIYDCTCRNMYGAYCMQYSYIVCTEYIDITVKGLKVHLQADRLCVSRLLREDTILTWPSYRNTLQPVLLLWGDLRILLVTRHSRWAIFGHEPYLIIACFARYRVALAVVNRISLHYKASFKVR